MVIVGAPRYWLSSARLWFAYGLAIFRESIRPSSCLAPGQRRLRQLEAVWYLFCFYSFLCMDSPALQLLGSQTSFRADCSIQGSCPKRGPGRICHHFKASFRSQGSYKAPASFKRRRHTPSSGETCIKDSLGMFLDPHRTVQTSGRKPERE